jgi:7-carboxy-7-deazaguanine synthase
VKAHPARHVVVTGGEPMILPEIVAAHRAAARARAAHHHRNGRHGVSPVACDLMSISPKALQFHASGPWAAQHDRLRIQPGTLRELMGRYPYQLKFVIAGRAIWRKCAALVETCGPIASA